MKNRIIYCILSLTLILLTPLIWIALAVRLYKGKEDKIRIWEKFGFSKISRPKNPVIWIHGASVGEMNSSTEFMEEMHKLYPNFFFLMTTGTKTSADLVTKILSQKSYAVHQFAPLDNPIWVNRFLNHWKPALAFRVDSEIWPITLYQIGSRKIPHFIINGRMMNKSLKSYTRFSWLKNFLNNSFTGCYAKDEADKKRFIEFGIKNTKNFGNLKFDASKPKFDAAELKKLSSKLKDKTIIHFAQLSEFEEEMTLEIYKEMNKKIRNLFFVITPRNIKRTEEFLSLARGHKIKISTRSKHEEIKPDTQIYLADTMGEIGLFYALTKFAFLGRSMGGKFYGSNPIEPLQFNDIILTGPHTSAFESLYSGLIKNDVVILCKTSADISKNFLKILNDKKEQSDRIKLGEKYLSENKDVGKKILKDLTPILRKIK